MVVVKRLKPEDCRHPMSRRVVRKAVVLREKLTVERCLDCGIQILSPRDTNRLLGRTRKLTALRQ